MLARASKAAGMTSSGFASEAALAVTKGGELPEHGPFGEQLRLHGAEATGNREEVVTDMVFCMRQRSEVQRGAERSPLEEPDRLSGRHRRRNSVLRMRTPSSPAGHLAPGGNPRVKGTQSVAGRRCRSPLGPEVREHPDLRDRKGGDDGSVEEGVPAQLPRGKPDEHEASPTMEARAGQATFAWSSDSEPALGDSARRASKMRIMGRAFGTPRAGREPSRSMLLCLVKGRFAACAPAGWVEAGQG